MLIVKQVLRLIFSSILCRNHLEYHLCRNLHGTKSSACSRSIKDICLEEGFSWTDEEKTGGLGNLSNLTETKQNGS